MSFKLVNSVLYQLLIDYSNVFRAVLEFGGSDNKYKKTLTHDYLVICFYLSVKSMQNGLKEANKFIHNSMIVQTLINRSSF